MDDSHALLLVPEVARELRVSERTVRRHIAAGDLDVIRFGRSVRVPRTALAALARGAR
jgi:excisionase family DNA binding protein